MRKTITINKITLRRFSRIFHLVNRTLVGTKAKSKERQIWKNMMQWTIWITLSYLNSKDFAFEENFP